MPRPYAQVGSRVIATSALADIYANVLAIRDFLEVDDGDTEEEA